MQYRPDVAGLRAVAVLPILFLHAGMSFFPGGFVGVDIFFVISGYLITSIIVREMDGDGFSLFGFYRRRAVRILPALLAMLLVTLAVGAWLLFPDDLASLGRSTAATALSVSNVWFWRNVSYFGTRAELEPLLHTWSLGVEEQYYIFYPFFLIAVRRFAAAHLKAALWLVLFASFAIGWALLPDKATFAFYMLPSRAWELALGGLVALGGFPAVARARTRAVLSGAGLTLVVIGLLLISSDMAFPVPWALLPCAGTALLIAYGERGPTARLLSFAPMRFVGDISYSLYLWHWPVMSFWRFQRGIALSPWEMTATIGISFVLATASYRWIERPFLTRYRQGAARLIVAVAAIAMIAVALIAATTARFAPQIRSLDPRVAAVMETIGYPQSTTQKAQFAVGRCHVTVESPTFLDACLAPATEGRNILLLGDSHAAQLSQALHERLGSDAHLLQATASGCRPILPYAGEARCTRVMRRAVEGTVAHGKVDRVILAAHWRAGELGGVRKMVEALRAKGIAVTILGPVMRYEEDMPRVLARSIANEDPAMVARTGDPTRGSLDRALAKAVAGTGAQYVSMIALECPRGVCPTVAPDGRPFHFDTTHFTLSASRVMVGRLPAAALL